MQKCITGLRTNIMGTGKYATLLALLAILVIATAEDVTETEQQPVTPGDLLSTLKDIRHSLADQIAALKLSRPSDDKSERSHLVQHYTAQKNNIEHEISLIQSLKQSPASDPSPRHILTSLGGPEEKIVPSLINIFKKSPKPSSEPPSNNYAYNFPPSYPSYYYPGYPGYPGFGPQFPYPYQGAPPPPPLRPNPSNTDNLVQSTFAGYEANNSNSQTFLTRNQVPTEDARPDPPPPPPAPLPPAAPQVNLQGEVPPQAQPAAAPQPPPIAPVPPQNSMGIFVYYPNGVITEDEEPQERPSIVDRVGQAFDRFGQVITNLASLRSAGSSDGILAHSPPVTRLRVTQNRPRSSSTEKASKARAVAEKDGTTPAAKFGERQRRRRPLTPEKMSKGKTPDKREGERRQSQPRASSAEEAPLVERNQKYRWVAV